MVLQPLLFTLEAILQVKYEENLMMPVSLFFFTTLDLIWPKFCSKITRTFELFRWFPIKYVREFN